jgi:hypothetical protein
VALILALVVAIGAGGFGIYSTLRAEKPEVASFRRAGEAALDGIRSSPVRTVPRAFGTDVEANGVRVTISEPNATVVVEVLAAVPPDALEIEVNDIRWVAM